ncbi:phosphoglucosamine mutase [Desulfosoma caldarium]|uniref:Phosphoglucosamine mutase n=1 Tax=Desulfosoma caldarium TaxID=610254 RepID=A0A3N1VJN7_9BACT|nr:phosphoglucosamine mutase [Desulfosoma caldarium]ROR03034.1 phosphoglucosamine mutase [Desulfosoma caldarium]
MGKLFGTDGIRGIANQFPMTTDIAMKVGIGAAYLFKSRHRRPKIVIGKDTRLSGYMIENAMTAGICAMGVDVLLLGPLPTPGIAFITASMRADAGIVISASHNPYEYNGIKIFASNGFKLPDHVEDEIERLVLNGEVDSLPRPNVADIGRARRIDDAQGRYIVFLKNTFPRNQTLEGLRIVLDCAHGAAYRVAPSVFEELGAQVILTGDRPNGKNINDGCGSLHPENMARLVREHQAHLGIAFDGDADRVILADEKGEVLDGDQVMAICAKHLAKKGKLCKQTVVATVMSNMGLEVALRNMGISLVRTPVGDRYVVERMTQDQLNLGGEQSGHIVFMDHSTTGDGILSALQVLSVMMEADKPLSELKTIMERFPQTLMNVRVTQKKDIHEIPEIMAQVARVEKLLGNDGRCLIRPSGTEPVIRIMIEGRDEQRIQELAEDLAQLIEKHLHHP